MCNVCEYVFHSSLHTLSFLPPFSLSPSTSFTFTVTHTHRHTHSPSPSSQDMMLSTICELSWANTTLNPRVYLPLVSHHCRMAEWRRKGQTRCHLNLHDVRERDCRHIEEAVATHVLTYSRMSPAVQ